ncbi:S-protein homolog 29-like [Vicia villosa]|uniref:S-protein homolog 29-like n=1 Tax=Vicia villosa TaxID=3911 RepID=UPI00273AEE40|nr:S-protein homolog 29-like [Vicia villosa]XP_058725330.1 S-protein homolog 29-like [Vicia villosa]
MQNVHGVHVNVVNSIDGLFNKIHVNIVNSLEGNLDLNLHCKSKDDDLGDHLLHHGERFSFSFRPKWFAKTLFFCSFVWNGELHWFDIFIDWDMPRADCHSCNWNVYKSGPCRTPELPTDKPICLPWNKPQ